MEPLTRVIPPPFPALPLVLSAHSAAAALAAWLMLEGTRHSPTPGPWHMLIPLPAMFFPGHAHGSLSPFFLGFCPHAQ